MGTPGTAIIRTSGKGGIKANGKAALFDAGGGGCECCGCSGNYPVVYNDDFFGGIDPNWTTTQGPGLAINSGHLDLSADPNDISEHAFPFNGPDANGFELEINMTDLVAPDPPSGVNFLYVLTNDTLLQGPGFYLRRSTTETQAWIIFNEIGSPVYAGNVDPTATFLFTYVRDGMNSELTLAENGTELLKFGSFEYERTDEPYWTCGFPLRLRAWYNTSLFGAEKIIAQIDSINFSWT